jgi:outer membrane lipoprotein-sorting protein
MKSFAYLRCLSVIAMITVALFAPSGPASYGATAADSYRHMVEAIKSLKTYQVTVHEQMVLQPTVPGAKARTINSTDHIYYKAPNRFYLNNDGLMGGAEMVCDGKNEFVYSRFTQQYASNPQSAEIVSNILAGLAGNKIVWTSAVPAKLNGVAVVLLNGKISGPGRVTQVKLYLRKSDSLPVWAEVKYPSISSATGNGIEITRKESFTNQRINEPISDSVFRFNPPGGATKVDSIRDLPAGMAAEGLG